MNEYCTMNIILFLSSSGLLVPRCCRCSVLFISHVLNVFYLLSFISSECDRRVLFHDFVQCQKQYPLLLRKLRQTRRLPSELLSFDELYVVESLVYLWSLGDGSEFIDVLLCVAEFMLLYIFLLCPLVWRAINMQAC